MKVYCTKLASILLIGTSAVVQAQPRSPNAPRPTAPRKPSAPVPKPVPSKPLAPVTKPVAAVPKPAASVPKPAASVPKPVAAAPKPVVSAPKPAASVPKPVAAAPKPAASVPKPVAAAPKPVVSAPKPVAPVSVSSCPVIAPYTAPPASQCTNCYRNMTALTTYLNSASNVVSATICSGTYAWPATAAVNNTNIKSLTLSCCGKANSCIIDGGAGGAPVVKRSKRLFTFLQPITLDIQGIMFQNIDCSVSEDCYGGLLGTNNSALVTFKHNTVSKVTTDYEGYGALSIYRGKFVVFENCTFSDSLGYPAGVYIKYSSLLMNGNSFFRNKGWGGVSMYIENSHAKANCNKFEENEANGDPGYGAAFYLFESSLDAKLNIFTKNKAIGGYGGAIEVDFSQLYLTSNTFTSNTAAYGGAILGYESAMMTNADSFTDNAASVNGTNIFLDSSVLKTCPGTLPGVSVDPVSFTVVQCV